MKWQALQLALQCVEFDIYCVAIGSNCVEIYTRFNVNKCITKQYRENLYQVLLSLFKALCNWSPVKTNIFATFPKQNIFALSLVQHIYTGIEIAQITV